jgi:hypothetical protein
MSAGTSNSANITAVIGASGMGKGLYVKEELRRWRGPILVWSPLERTDQYASAIGGKCVSSIAAMVEAIEKGQRRLVLVPPSDPKAVKVMFDRFCRVAWELKGWCVVVEELSRVTMPSWAPPAWKNLSTAGRHQGLKVIGTSQRPAQIDKDFLGNCSEVRCYAVVYPEDAKAMAGVMRVEREALLDLPKFHYLHRHMAEKRNVSGVVSVPQSPKK